MTTEFDQKLGTILTTEFDQELEAKIRASSLSMTEVVMLGFATGRTPNNYHELFEALLDRKLTGDEQCALEDLEGEQYCRVEDIIGPLTPEEHAAMMARIEQIAEENRAT